MAWIIFTHAILLTAYCLLLTDSRRGEAAQRDGARKDGAREPESIECSSWRHYSTKSIKNKTHFGLALPARAELAGKTQK